MRFLKCIAIGLALWSLSLIWPDLNRILTEPTMVKLLLGLILVALIYLLERRLNHPDNGIESPDAGHAHQEHNARSWAASVAQHLRRRSLISTV